MKVKRKSLSSKIPISWVHDPVVISFHNCLYLKTRERKWSLGLGVVGSEGGRGGTHAESCFPQKREKEVSAGIKTSKYKLKKMLVPIFGK